jgi:hypothetical protein
MAHYNHWLIGFLMGIALPSILIIIHSIFGDSWETLGKHAQGTAIGGLGSVAIFGLGFWLELRGRNKTTS